MSRPPPCRTAGPRPSVRDPRGTDFIVYYRPEGLFLVALRLTCGFSGPTDVRDLRPASPVPF